MPHDPGVTVLQHRVHASWWESEEEEHPSLPVSD